MKPRCRATTALPTAVAGGRLTLVLIGETS